MLLKLSLQNISDKKFRNLLAGFAIMIGTAALLVFLSLSNGIQNATFSQLQENNPLTQITIHPNTQKTGIISLLAQSGEGKLTNKTLEELVNIDGIKNIYPEIQFNSLASIEASVFGFSMITDTMIFGLDEGFIKNSIPSCKNQEKCDLWQIAKEPYPTIIPSRLLDIYNFAVASPQGLPLLSEKALIGKQLKLYPNYSTLFPSLNNKKTEIALVVVGFSDNVNLVGATVPYSLVEKLNQEYTSDPVSKITEIFAETSDASKTTEVANQIEKLGYSTSYYQKNLKDVEAKLNYLSIAIGIISGIILLLSAIAIISTFLAIAEERKKEIGLLRAVGATKSHIRKIILIEAGIIGVLGSIAGVIIGIIASLILNKIGLDQLSSISTTPPDLFSTTPILILSTLIFGILLTILSALIPAIKASNISPIQALK